MVYVSCESKIVKLELENPGHQIFKNLKEEFCEERIAVIKKIAALADYYKINDLIEVIEKYIEDGNEDKAFNLPRAILFEAKIEEYKASFKKIMKLFSKIEAEEIFELPISSDYAIEEWVVKWNAHNSYSFLPKLKKWFEIDFNKLTLLQNESEISYDTAVSILENIEYWKMERKLLEMIENIKFNIIEENKIYTSFELYFDVLSKCDCSYIVDSIEVFISSISLKKLKKNVKKYWEKYKYDTSTGMYYSSFGEELSKDEAVMLGVEPNAKKFFRNYILEILHEYNLQIKLPKYISCNI